MDGSEVIDSLDTLWFFSNIFSSKSHNLASNSAHDDDIHSTTPITLKELSKSKPISIPMNLNTQYPPFPEMLIHSSPNCIEIVAETLPQRAKTEPIKVPESSETQHRNKRRRKARKKRNLDGRRRILGEIDLADQGVKNSDNNNNYMEFDDVNRVSGCWIDEENSGSGNKMPPFNDGFAMKEHLKSWAHAVACTVK